MIWLTRRAAQLSMMLAAIGLTACHDDGGTTVVPVATVSLGSTSLELQPLDTARISASALSATGASLTGRAATWVSADPAIVSVTASGRLFGVKEGGPVAVTATIDGKSASVSVTVRYQPPASLEIIRPNGMRDTVRGVNVRFPLRLVAKDAAGRLSPTSDAQWTSSNSGIATVDSTGVVRVATAGSTQIAVTVRGVTTRWQATAVRTRTIQVDPYLATPIAGAIWEVPVVLIEYLPTADGTTIDTLRNPDFYVAGPMTLDSAERRILTFAQRRKMGVEQGSRFRGYKDSTALPSLGYRVVQHTIVYDLTPPSALQRETRIPGSPAFPDWFRIFSDLNLEPLMRARNVREIWIAESGVDGNYPSYKPGVMDTANFRTNAESNMSSPVTGDISNSFRVANDLPILSHTYVVYGINYRRTQAEAIHNVGHQLEAMLSYVSQRQVGSDRLFWNDFVGRNAQGQFTTGRAGWTHMPPNTVGNYDYLNRTPVDSDIEDWRPDGGGVKKPVNVDTWGLLKYPWPGDQEFDQRAETQWYTYWFQNFPGRGNRIPSGTGWMTNWWAFVGDWDAAIRSNLMLSGNTPAATRGTALPPSTSIAAAAQTFEERSPMRH